MSAEREDCRVESSCEASELAELMGRLVDELTVARQAVDELREELTYELRKLRDEVARSPPPFRLTSMPRDPCAADFHQRVNAMNPDGIAAAAPTVEDFVRQMMTPAVERLAAKDWIKDQDFPPGVVIEIEAATFDWFAEYPVTVQQGPEWFLVDDGLGNFFLLWQRSGSLFLRLLTVHEKQKLSGLTGIVPDLDAQAEDEAAPQDAARAISQAAGSAAEPQQRILW